MVRISEVFLQIQRNYNSTVRRADYVISTTTTKFTLRKSITGHKYNLQREAFRWTTTEDVLALMISDFID